MLSRAVGDAVASAMLLFGLELDATEAVKRGLALCEFAESSLLPSALALAENAASVPRALAIRIKETLRAGASSPAT